MSSLTLTEFIDWYKAGRPRSLNQINRIFTFNLKQLRKYNIQNEFPFIVEELNQLPNIKTLVIYDLILPEVPESIGNLRYIKSLHFMNNNLANFPNGVLNLTQLEELIIANNNIVSIPENIGNLRNLRRLNLMKNRIRTLPESFQNLNLDELTLLGNPIDTLPQSIVNWIGRQTGHLHIPNYRIGRPDTLHTEAMKMDRSTIFTVLHSIIGTPSKRSVTDFKKFMNTTMEQFIGQAPSIAKRAPVQEYYTQVKERIHGMDFSIEDIELYTLVLEYVKRQSPSFQFNYVLNFSSDCARAYNSGYAMSCGQGIKQRIVSSLIPSCTLYLGTDAFKAQKCGPIINALENKEIYKNNVTTAGPSISMIINTFKYPILKKLQEAICYAATNSSSASAKKTNLTAPQAEKKYREMLLQAVYNKIRSKDKKQEIINGVEAVMKELGAGSEYSPFDPDMICEFAVPMDGGKRKKRQQTCRKAQKMRGKTRRRVIKK